jgi:hypothetical protein
MLHKVTFWVEGETVDIKMGKTKKKKGRRDIFITEYQYLSLRKRFGML